MSIARIELFRERYSDFSTDVASVSLSNMTWRQQLEDVKIIGRRYDGWVPANHKIWVEF